jgi:hypothetical protein
MCADDARERGRAGQAVDARLRDSRRDELFETEGRDEGAMVVGCRV